MASVAKSDKCGRSKVTIRAISKSNRTEGVGGHVRSACVPSEAREAIADSLQPSSNYSRFEKAIVYLCFASGQKQHPLAEFMQQRTAIG